MHLSLWTPHRLVSYVSKLIDHFIGGYGVEQRQQPGHNGGIAGAALGQNDAIVLSPFRQLAPMELLEVVTVVGEQSAFLRNSEGELSFIIQV